MIVLQLQIRGTPVGKGDLEEDLCARGYNWDGIRLRQGHKQEAVQVQQHVSDVRTALCFQGSGRETLLRGWIWQHIYKSVIHFRAAVSAFRCFAGYCVRNV